MFLSEVAVSRSERRTSRCCVRVEKYIWGFGKQDVIFFDLFKQKLLNCDNPIREFKIKHATYSGRRVWMLRIWQRLFCPNKGAGFRHPAFLVGLRGDHRLHPAVVVLVSLSSRMPCETCSVFISEKLRVWFIKAAWDEYRRLEKRVHVSVIQVSLEGIWLQMVQGQQLKNF